MVLSQPTQTRNTYESRHCLSSTEKYPCKNQVGVRSKAGTALGSLKEPTLDQPKPEILLADWLDLCYQEYKKPNLLPNTQMSYERRIYQHIILKLGQIQPDKLNTTDIQEFYVSLKKDGRLIRVEFYGKGLSD